MSFDFKLVGGSFSITNGEADLVTNLDKLSQDVIKIIATEIGTVKLHKWYGTSLQAQIVGSVSGGNFLKNEIIRSVNFALQNLKSIQEQTERSGQLKSPREMIARIDSINVLDTGDPRQLIIQILITTRAGTKFQEELPINL